MAPRLMLAWLGTMVAALRLPDAISTNMVLPRDPHTPRLWGFGDVSEVITVTLDGATKSTTVDASGSWVLDLDKQTASSGRTILIASSSGESTTLKNIAFGDVYLCSGQSNMEMSVNGAFDAEVEIADSVNYPNLRFYAEDRNTSDVPEHDGGHKASYQWGVSQPKSFQPASSTATFSWFSATCYFFGRDLYKAFGNTVPIGLVASDWGGMKIEVFSSPDALADKTCGGTVNISHREPSLLDAVLNANVSQADGDNPSDSQLWFAMIYPWINMRFTGAIWYQGEANADDPSSYACRFPAMIADWRKKFALPDLSFFFVQLAAFDATWAEFRDAQMAALRLPKTGYAAAIDLGDRGSPAGSIHPRRKQEVGRRLALACQKVQYGFSVVSTGPEFESYNVSATGVAITFQKETSAGLHLSGAAECKECCALSPFEVLLSPSNLWKRTGAPIIAGNVITAPVTPVDGETVAGIRLEWEGFPQCALYNGQGGADDHIGIAAAPFRRLLPSVVNLAIESHFAVMI